MQKILSAKFFWLAVIIVVGLSVGLHLISGGFSTAAGSAEQELERLFGNIGVLKFPQATRPVDIQLKDASGNTVSLSDFRGKIVFLNFWATWCPTCVVEMPSMEKLHRRFKDQDFALITVNLQESEAQVKSFFEKFKLTFIALLDSSGEVASALAVNALPTTFVLDRSGRIIGMALGPREWDHQASLKLFEYLINRRTEPVATPSGS